MISEGLPQQRRPNRPWFSPERRPSSTPSRDDGGRADSGTRFLPWFRQRMTFSSGRFALVAAASFLIPSPVEGQQIPLQGINLVERVVAVVGDSMI